LVMPVGTEQNLQHLVRVTRQPDSTYPRKNSAMSASCRSSALRGGRSQRRNGLGHRRAPPADPKPQCN
jgi:hypothetical protein